MKKTLLRFLAFMLVLITAFSFIACDGDPTPGPDPDPDPDPTPDPVPTDTLPENVSGTLDIYISLNEDEAAAYQMVADEYTYLQKEKGNTVKVNINNNSTADSYQKEVEALISMGVSNATIAKTGVAPSYYGTDSIVDLSSYLSLKNPYADNQVWKDVLEPEAYAPKFARGKSTVPSISYDTNYLVVFYDTRALADLGLQVPTTWDEMIACLEAASKDSDFRNPLGLGVDSGSATRTFLAWVVQMYMDQYFRDFIDVAHSQKGDYSYSSRIDGSYEYDLSDLLLGDSSNYTYNLNRMIDAYFNDTDEWGPLSPRFQDMMANLQELLPYIDTKASYGDLFNRFNETASSYNADGSDNGLYHDRKIFYIQRLDYILTYKTAFETKGTKLSVKDIGDRLGWFALPPMTDHGDDGVGAPAADTVRSLGGVESELGVINSGNQAHTDLAVDFLAYFYSPQGMNVRLQALALTGTPLVMEQLVKGVTIPENIDLVTNALKFTGNCNLNPYLQFGYGYTNANIKVGDTNNTVINTVANNFADFFKSSSNNWADYGKKMLDAITDGFKNYATDQKLIYDTYENVKEATEEYKKSPYSSN